jgi:hypothetical protein
MILVECFPRGKNTVQGQGVLHFQFFSGVMLDWFSCYREVRIDHCYRQMIAHPVSFSDLLTRPGRLRGLISRVLNHTPHSSTAHTVSNFRAVALAQPFCCCNICYTGLVDPGRRTEGIFCWVPGQRPNN